LEQESLVTISEACRVLGVSEAALRQWTDEGKVKAFITPGGHRRYSIRELKRLMGSHQKMLGVKDLAGKLEGSAQVHRDVAMGFLQGTGWYDGLSAESQGQLASLSRQLMKLIVSYVAQPARREETLGQARAAGAGFGELLANLRLPLTDSVQAFILHRGPVQSVAVQMMRKRANTERIAEAIPMVDRVMDEALISLIGAHERHRKG
jgi:excisionase family DNA binding protein